MVRTVVLTSLFKSKSKLFFLALSLLMLAGCATGRPSLDYVLAREALQAAKDSESARYAPGLYHRAEESFRRGVRLYNELEYEDASEDFFDARVNAEKAEDSARVQRQKAGDEGI